MARPIRIEYENAFYHITSRGNARGRIYRDDYDRDMFLDIVKSAYSRFSFVIHAFVLMNNHYHFLMETPRANLCASMHHINGVYTQAHNRRHKVVGHLFQGRYKAVVVDRDAYYLELIRYIHLNPWRAKMVKRLEDFKYSGHRAVIDKEWARRWKDWYDRDVVLKEFGRKETESLKRYLGFVNAGKGMASPIENAIGGYALGGRSFADWLWEKFIDGKDHRELSGSRHMRVRIDFDDIVSAVSREFKVAPEDVFKSDRGRRGVNLRRGAALYLLNRHSGMIQKEIGRHAGGMSRSAVSEAVRRFEKTLTKDAVAKRLCERLSKKIQ